MKIIEAMKRVKLNKEKIADLQKKIGLNCAALSFETPLYGEAQRSTVDGWLQSCNDLAQENVALLVAIARTNLVTPVTITLGEKQVTKTISEWIWRRREYAALDALTWTTLGDRNLREGKGTNSQGAEVDVKIVRFFDATVRDEKLAVYRSEPHVIDAAMEVVNATTELVEEATIT